MRGERSGARLTSDRVERHTMVPSLPACPMRGENSISAPETNNRDAAACKGLEQPAWRGGCGREGGREGGRKMGAWQ